MLYRISPSLRLYNTRIVTRNLRPEAIRFFATRPSKPFSPAQKAKQIADETARTIEAQKASKQAEEQHGARFFSSRTPAPLFYKLLAIGSVCVLYINTFKPFAFQKKEGDVKSTTPSLTPAQFVKCQVHSVEAAVPAEPMKDSLSTTYVKPSTKSPTKAEHIILQLGIPPQFLSKSSEHLGNAIYHIYIKDDDMQVERPYTPINGIGMDGKFSLWVKRYPGGEVSNWLSRLAKGRSIEVRGIVRQWDWREKDVDEIVMIAGGTGVTAFNQLLHQALFSSQPVTTSVNSLTHFTLLHGHQIPSALPPTLVTDEFATYRQSTPERFTERCFVERPDGEMDDVPRGVELGMIGKDALVKSLVERGILVEEETKEAHGSSILGSINPWNKAIPPKAKQRHINPDKSVMILVCGPERMVSAMAGPRPRKSQVDENAPVGGILGELGFKPSQVRRL